MPLRQALARLRARLIFPALAVALGLSTLVAGLEHTTFIVHSAAVAASSEKPGMDVVPPTSTVISAASDSTFASLDMSVDHRRIDQWVQRLTTSLRADFTTSLARMDKYSDMITAKLDARQMPRELIYLAMIESNFNPEARSKVGAVGMWQFMSATARQFGLTVTGRTDERKDPVDATDAALTYLSHLHARFGSWYLAAAAYNSGAGTVSKALKKVTGKTQGTDEDFFRIISSLPRETQDYVPKLIASALVGSDPAKYGL